MTAGDQRLKEWIIGIALLITAVKRRVIGRIQRGVPGEAFREVRIGKKEPAEGNQIRIPAPEVGLGAIVVEASVGDVYPPEGLTQSPEVNNLPCRLLGLINLHDMEIREPEPAEPFGHIPERRLRV
jgi:hypothetical protein